MVISIFSPHHVLPVHLCRQTPVAAGDGMACSPAWDNGINGIACGPGKRGVCIGICQRNGQTVGTNARLRSHVYNQGFGRCACSCRGSGIVIDNAIGSDDLADCSGRLRCRGNCVRPGMRAVGVVRAGAADDGKARGGEHRTYIQCCCGGMFVETDSG